MARPCVPAASARHGGPGSRQGHGHGGKPGSSSTRPRRGQEPILPAPPRGGDRQGRHPQDVYARNRYPWCKNKKQPCMSREPESAGESPAERQLRQQLDAADQRMRAVMHGISHDLRAPVRAIDGFVARLGRQLEPIADQATADSVQRIRGAVQRMSGLIDGLLELARAGNAPLNPTQVDVSMLADWCLAELQDLEPARDVQADVEQGLSVLGDERLLKMMLAQLL
ncbi:MAG: HAMP domain-containing histidine kinase, partial [Lysobacteraceae bacterium]